MAFTVPFGRGLVRWILPVLFLLSAAFDIRAEIPDSDCMECHADVELTDEAGRSMSVPEDALSGTAHEGIECVACHTGIEELPHEGPAPVQCRVCHEETEEVYETSAHGQAALRGDPDAPSCADCHGTHKILAADDPGSKVHPRNLIETCARCHADPKVVRRHPFTVRAPVEAYRQSAHYRALAERGVARAPSCSDCHGSHDLKASRDSDSAISWKHVSKTCGKCHAGILAVYRESVHGKATASGVRDAPVCTDCHGEHEIRGPEDPKSTVYPAHISQTTCVWCHESERIAKKYGLSAQRLSTYLDSYHGLADRAGSTVVANCASCHGIHDIFPSDDPRSSTNPAKLPETCGACHPGAGKNFAMGTIHVDPGKEKAGNLAVYYVRLFYIQLILLSVGGMLLHNGLDFARNFRAQRLPAGNDHLRFNGAERLQHATMAISFIVLAYSGFSLVFPDAWWTAPFVWLGFGEAGRRLVHRAAAVAMVAVCIHHIGYAALTRRGRGHLLAMLPRLKDVRDAVHMFAYYLGRRPHHPRFARFSYIEKVEYWALVWGSAVMTATGFALWFENIALRLVPKWGLDVATTIHYYEAWLAVLAILVWHFYWVIFNPKFYPMSLVWLTGGMSEEAMAEEHPLELAEIRKGRRDEG